MCKNTQNLASQYLFMRPGGCTAPYTGTSLTFFFLPRGSRELGHPSQVLVIYQTKIGHICISGYINIFRALILLLGKPAYHAVIKKIHCNPNIHIMTSYHSPPKKDINNHLLARVLGLNLKIVKKNLINYFPRISSLSINRYN